MTKYLTTKQAAERYKGTGKIGCLQQYICRLAREGRIKGAKRFGNQYKIPETWEKLESLDELLIRKGFKTMSLEERKDRLEDIIIFGE